MRSPLERVVVLDTVIGIQYMAALVLFSVLLVKNHILHPAPCFLIMFWILGEIGRLPLILLFLLMSHVWTAELIPIICKNFSFMGKEVYFLQQFKKISAAAYHLTPTCVSCVTILYAPPGSWSRLFSLPSHRWVSGWLLFFSIWC